MGFSLVHGLEVTSSYGKIVLDFAICPIVRRDPMNYPGLPDGLEVEILRKEVPDFHYNKYRDGYLLTEDYQDANVIYKGRPERKSENLFRYSDDSAVKGSVYVYWVTTALNERPLGPVHVRVVDNDIIWTHGKTSAECSRIASQYEGVVLESHGMSVRGNEMLSLKKGNMENAVIIIGGVHAAEAGQFTALDVFERFCALNDRLLFEKVGLAVMPSANPDEADRMAKGHTYYLRKNAAGVDLNRNFPSDWEVVDEMYGLNTADPTSLTYRGPVPASEPESKAIMKFIESTVPRAVFSLHCYPGGITFDQLFGPGAAEDDAAYVKECTELANSYTEGFRKGEYPGQLFLAFGTTPGSLPLWIYRTFKVPSFDMEAWEWFVRNHPMALLACEFKADVHMMRDVAKRHFDGTMKYIEEVLLT